MIVHKTFDHKNNNDTNLIVFRTAWPSKKSSQIHVFL